MTINLLSRAAFAALATAGVASAQNECTGAVNLPLGVATPFSTVGATTSAPAWPCAAGGSDIWYQITVGTAGSLNVSTCGSGYDCALELFSGTCAGLTSIGCNDDSCGLQSVLNVPVGVGSYFLRVGGFNGATGAGTVTAAVIGPATNDECATAIQILANAPTVFNTATATTGGDVFGCSTGAAPHTNDIWYRYTATSNLDIEVSLCGSGFDTLLQSWSGACGSLTSLACNDDSCGLQSVIQFSGVSGQSYYIQVAGWNGASGIGTVQITETIPPNVSRFNGTPPGAGPALNFDTPLVPSGPIASNSPTFTGAGIASVSLFGTWSALGDAMTVGSNVNGQALVSVNGVLSIAGPNQPLDSPGAGAGFDIRLASPATAFGLQPVDQVGFTYDIALYLGATLIGSGQFIYAPSNTFPSPPDYWTTTGGAFDRIVFTDTVGTGAGWGIDDISFVGGNPTVGTNYCMANPNSTGQTGLITGLGSAVVASNNLTLAASRLPNNAFGYFLTSLTQGFTPNPGGSVGNLCLGGSIGRYNGAGQIQNSGGTGSFSLLLNLNQIPTPTGFVTAVVGQTRSFQTWHRDSIGGIAVSNFTNGLAVTFQ